MSIGNAIQHLLPAHLQLLERWAAGGGPLSEAEVMQLRSAVNDCSSRLANSFAFERDDARRQGLQVLYEGLQGLQSVLARMQQ